MKCKYKDYHCVDEDLGIDFGIDTAGLGSGFLYNLQMLHCFVVSSRIFEIFFVSTLAFFIKFNKLLLKACPNCLSHFINFFRFSSIVSFSSNINTCSVSSKSDVISGKTDIK